MRLAGTRDDERFFVSRFVPRPLLLVNVGIAKLIVWYPWPFISLSFGWFGGIGPKVRALQCYLGIKLDGTQTVLHGQPVMVLTPKELAAFRIHDVDVGCEYDNMGGS